MPCGCGWRIRRKSNESAATCTPLDRLKGGCFALKASDSGNGSHGWIRTSTGGVLDAVPLPIGLRDRGCEMAPVVRLAPTRVGLKNRALGSLHSRVLKNGGTRRACSPSRKMRDDFFSKECPRECAFQKGKLTRMGDSQSRLACPDHVPWCSRSDSHRH
jgi:hypothetical protein